MKKLSLYLLLGVLFTSCASTYQEIGSMNVLSNKHIDPKGHYQKLVAGAGNSSKILKKSEATNIDTAITQVLNQIPGADYMTNVKIYVVKGEFIAVSGDVWGKVNDNQTPVQDNNKAVATILASTNR